MEFAIEYPVEDEFKQNTRYSYNDKEVDNYNTLM